MRCQKRFSLITTKRHCRRCGQVLCYNCCQASSDKSWGFGGRITRRIDHICEQCRSFEARNAGGGKSLRRFEDGVMSYLVRVDATRLDRRGTSESKCED